MQRIPLKSGETLAAENAVRDHSRGRAHTYVASAVDGGNDPATIAPWAFANARSIEETLFAIMCRPRSRAREDIPLVDDLVRLGWLTDEARPTVTPFGIDAQEVLNRCIAADRTEEVRRFLLSRGGVGQASRVLDVGCSTGVILRALAKTGPSLVVGADCDLLALHLASLSWKSQGATRADWYCASSDNLPFADGTFTHVLSFVTLNFVDVHSTLVEFERVLEPGGRLVLAVEGEGYWKRQWRMGRGLRKVHLLRERLGDWLHPHFDWQRHPYLKNLSKHVHFTEKSVQRWLRQTGFEIETLDVLREDDGLPWIYGVIARRRAAARAA
jgi:ubiquinone/menaquinone biosynthesis C-methylase UbiE